nr:ORF3 [Clover yellow mosaic virus]
MSGAPIHLRPPPDNSKAFLAAVVGVSIALVIFTITRSTLPYVGDNIHQLPHGGQYRDGTKAISYQGSRSSNPSIKSSLPLLLVITLPAIIYALSPSRTIRSCNNPACPALHHQR